MSPHFYDNCQGLSIYYYNDFAAAIQKVNVIKLARIIGHTKFMPCFIYAL